MMAAQNIVPSPAVVGTTSLPRQVLSYRWNISDAKIFLEPHQGALRSPTFSLTLPSASAKNAVKTLWFLELTKNPPNSSKLFGYGAFPPPLFILLWQGTGKGSPQLNYGQNAQYRTSVLLSDCKFSIVNTKSEAVFNAAATNTAARCDLYSYEKECSRAEFIKFADIDKYSHNSTLSVQVNATILCTGTPSEILEEEQPLPEYNGVKRLLDNKLFADLTVTCGKRRFKVHKAILAAQSPVFMRMLVTNMRERASSAITLTDIDPAVFSELLTYLYSGTAPNMKIFATDLLTVADKYQVSCLSMMCENHLKSTLEATSVVPLLVRADMHNATHLKEACLKYIHVNSAEVYKTSEWRQFKANKAANLSLLMEIMEYTL